MQYLNAFIDEFTRPEIQFVIGHVEHSDFKIGTRCIASVPDNLFDTSHEVAHLIQFTDDELQRCYLDYNGRMIFNYPHIEVCGQIVCEPSTDQISMRELETFVIQYYIMSKYEPMDYFDWLEEKDIISLFGWMPDDFIFSNGKKLTNEYIFQKSIPFITKWNFDNIKEQWFNLNLKSDNANEI